MLFEWDHVKAASNFKKHGISFERAVEIFDDPDFIEGYDTQHSQTEARYIRIGLSVGKVLVVVHTIRQGNRYRIISARRADRIERRLYYEKDRL